MSNTTRKQRQRAREENNLIVVPVEVHISEIAELIRLGQLLSDESEDRREIAVAIKAALADYFATVSRMYIQNSSAGV